MRKSVEGLAGLIMLTGGLIEITLTFSTLPAWIPPLSVTVLRSFILICYFLGILVIPKKDIILQPVSPTQKVTVEIMTAIILIGCALSFIRLWFVGCPIMGFGVFITLLVIIKLVKMGVIFISKKIYQHE